MLRTGAAIVLAGLFTYSPALAQIPGLAIPPAPVAAPAASAATAPAPAGGNLFDFFCPRPDQIAKLQKKFCSCQLGQLITNSLKPISALTGGIIHAELCPDENTPSPEDLAAPPDSAVGAAARIKADEANAKKRAEAVRYLATANCRYYPEAEAALIVSLRTDKNECVRLEAARALGTGCCCTKKTIAALVLTVNASDEDKNPVECSERVRAMALIALKHCLICYREPTSKQPEPPKAAAARTARDILPAYYSRVSDDIITQAQATVEKGNRTLAAAVALTSGRRSISDAFIAAATAPTNAEPPRTNSGPTFIVRNPLLPRPAPTPAAIMPMSIESVKRQVEPVTDLPSVTAGASPMPVAVAIPVHPPTAGTSAPTGQRSVFQIVRQAAQR